MKNILITGGASGLGRGITEKYLTEGATVIVIGHSISNCNEVLEYAKQMNASERIFCINADLTQISENERVIEEIYKRFSKLDGLILSATKHQKEFKKTTEGYERSFALDYLSRFILSYGLKDLLEKSDSPIIFNICGTGYKGEVNWTDIQHKHTFDPLKVMMHGSRLNELLALSFVNSDSTKKINYILYNPMAVKTPGMIDFNRGIMKIYYLIKAKNIHTAATLAYSLIESEHCNHGLTVYKELKKITLSKEYFTIENANKLNELTLTLLNTRIK